MKPLKIGVSLSLDDDIVERLRELAEYDDRSLSQYINLILRKYLNRLDDSQKKKNES